MRNKILLSAFALLALCFGDVFALQGGPDAYGYVWRDSNEPNGPTYVWNDIRNRTDAQQISGLADDNSVGPFNLNGWAFRYYWTDITSWKFGSNGWVSLDNNVGNIAHCFPTIPTAGGAADNYIAPFMTDINFSTSFPSFPNPGEVWYVDNGVDSLIIQWQDCPWWQNGTPDWVGSNTFQMILTMTDTSITFMYEDMDQNNFNNTGGCAADLEIGIENITGNVGLEVYNEVVPADNYAVKFYYPQNSSFQVPDAQPTWNANADNAGQFYLAGVTAQPETMVANIGNVGNADITSSINVSGLLRDQQLNQFWTSSATIPSLVAGADSTVNFPDQVTFNSPGQYTYIVETTNGQDINPSNNDNEVEISAIECLNDSMNLTYSIYHGTGNIQPDGLIAWTGGVWNEGGGLYIEPPVLPVTIEAVDVLVWGDGDLNTPMTSGFGIEIYNDVGGVPGALLSSDTVQAANVGESAWNRVVLSQPVTITSGGFYVAWLQGGSDIAMGTETLNPISRRTFEILSGVWAGYRTGTTDDFMLNVHTTTTCPAVSVTDPNMSTIALETSPNPSSGNTAINFEIPALGNATINVVNLQGQTVFTETMTDLVPGQHTLNYDVSSLRSGVYFVSMEFGSQKVTRKLIVTH